MAPSTRDSKSRLGGRALAALRSVRVPLTWFVPMPMRLGTWIAGWSGNRLTPLYSPHRFWELRKEWRGEESCLVLRILSGLRSETSCNTLGSVCGPLAYARLRFRRRRPSVGSPARRQSPAYVDGPVSADPPCHAMLRVLQQLRPRGFRPARVTTIRALSWAARSSGGTHGHWRGDPRSPRSKGFCDLSRLWSGEGDHSHSCTAQ